MNIYTFKKARRIFYPFSGVEAAERSKEAVNHYCFYKEIHLTEDFEDAILALSARNMYRVYVNDEVVMHGPARTAHGYCRVDEVDVTPYLQKGVNHLAVEVMVYGDVYSGYSNDSTLETGMFIGELTVDGQVISATGEDPWLT